MWVQKAEAIGEICFCWAWRGVRWGSHGMTPQFITTKDENLCLTGYNPSTWEVEVGRSGAQGHPQLHSKFEARLGYMRIVLRKKKDGVGQGKEEIAQGDSKTMLSGDTGVRASTKLCICLKPRTNLFCLGFHKDTSAWLCAGDKGPLQRHSRGAKYPSLPVTTLLAPMASALVHPPKLFRK